MTLRDRLASSDDPALGLGLRTRREVLGDDYVEAALDRAAGWGEPLQEVVTANVWGAGWNRPGLDRPSRSLVTISLLSAGGHVDELETHVRGGLRNGLTPEQIVEAVIHVGHYCGAPVALRAMRHVKAALEGAVGAAPAPPEGE